MKKKFLENKIYTNRYLTRQWKFSENILKWEQWFLIMTVFERFKKHFYETKLFMQSNFTLIPLLVFVIFSAIAVFWNRRRTTICSALFWFVFQTCSPEA